MPATLEPPPVRTQRVKPGPSFAWRLFVSAVRLTVILLLSAILGAAWYLAHKGFGREWRARVVEELHKHGVRIDGLAECLHSSEATLETSQDSAKMLQIKRTAISKYMFNFAFENSIHPGYVTEKPFDALIAGVVPVFLGDSEHLRSLLPDPAAAIFVSDYEADFERLSRYLIDLTTNESAYEIHRNWRSTFNYTNHLMQSPLLASSWQCRICEWMYNNRDKKSKSFHHCKG